MEEMFFVHPTLGVCAGRSTKEALWALKEEALHNWSALCYLLQETEALAQGPDPLGVLARRATAVRAAVKAAEVEKAEAFSAWWKA